MLTKDEAVCIRVSDYSETSQIVTFFTKQTGKISAIAKGAKRARSPFGGPVEIFSYGRIVFSDSGRDKLATLVEFEPACGSQRSSQLAADMAVLNCCLFAAELTGLLTKDYDAHPGLFDSLLALLRDACPPRNGEPQASRPSRRGASLKAGPPTSGQVGRRKILALLIAFQLGLLRDIGLSPILDSCANCKLPFTTDWPRFFFSSGAKGFVCPDCENSFPDRVEIDTEAAGCLAGAKSLDTSAEHALRQVEGVLIGYLTDILGRIPKMAGYILR